MLYQFRSLRDIVAGLVLGYDKTMVIQAGAIATSYPLHYIFCMREKRLFLKLVSDLQKFN